MTGRMRKQVLRLVPIAGPFFIDCSGCLFDVLSMMLDILDAPFDGFGIARQPALNAQRAQDYGKHNPHQGQYISTVGPTRHVLIPTDPCG